MSAYMRKFLDEWVLNEKFQPMKNFYFYAIFRDTWLFRKYIQGWYEAATTTFEITTVIENFQLKAQGKEVWNGAGLRLGSWNRWRLLFETLHGLELN